MNKIICFFSNINIKDYQIIIGFSITILGWIINNNFNKKRDRLNELNNIKSTYISNAYKNISFYSTLYNNKKLTKEYFIKFENSLKDIQLYGTLNEIKLAQKLINDLGKAKEGVNAEFDPLLNELRNNTRKIYNLENVNNNTYWIFDETLFKD